jgi:hypothetical protein
MPIEISGATIQGGVSVLPPPPATKAIFGYGQAVAGRVSITNLVSDTGVVGNDVTGVGTGRQAPAGMSYGTDKAIIGPGTYSGATATGISNLISNTGVVANDVTNSGTNKYFYGAAGYGTDKAIFAFGATTAGATNITTSNLVSNTGVIATDTAGASGTFSRYAPAAATYGTDKAIIGYGCNSTFTQTPSTTNLVSNTGVIAADQAAVTGTGRFALAAASYGGDKAIFGYGSSIQSADRYSVTNLVSNTGVVATDTTGVGTARNGLAAAGYGNDKAIFGYGYTEVPTAKLSITNLVSNTGVVATDTAGVGTVRQDLAAATYGG